MKRLISCLLASAMVSGMTIAANPNEAQAQVVYYPPAAYVAWYTPYYYNGYAHYLYRNNWYYRDHGGWRGYGREPGALYGQRGAWGARGWGGGGHGWGGGHGGGGHGGGGHGGGGHGR
jgi:hypothetical protein